jgi:amino acid transporter
MNPDYVVGNFRIHFASQKRRRRFVVLVYTVLGLLDLAFFIYPTRDAASAWTVAVSMIVVVVLIVVFTGVVGDMRFQGDERENYRRDHAHYLAYYRLGSGLVAALICSSLVHSPQITSHLSVAVREHLEHLPTVMLVGTGILYMTLPQAILLWTEPDMEESSEFATR